MSDQKPRTRKDLLIERLRAHIKELETGVRQADEMMRTGSSAPAIANKLLENRTIIMKLDDLSRKGRL